MATFWPVLLSAVGLVAFVTASHIISRIDYQWHRMRNAIPHTRAHRREVARALRRANFTVDDPVVRALMFERAKYLQSSGVRDLMWNTVFAAGFDLGFSWAYLSPLLFPYVIVIQALIFLLILDYAVANIHRLRNAKRLLSPWWATR
jgi:hypothetical protein